MEEYIEEGYATVCIFCGTHHTDIDYVYQVGWCSTCDAYTDGEI